jgi:hypothetical protein
MWKWLLGGIVVLLLLAIGYRLTVFERTNRAVAEEIRTQPDSARARQSMLVTLADGRTFPVNYLLEGDRVFMGIDGLWWRAFRGDGAPVSVLIRGEALTGHARVILDDPAYTTAVFSRLRPTVPEWLPDWLNGKLVVITLDEPRPVEDPPPPPADA